MKARTCAIIAADLAALSAHSPPPVPAAEKAVRQVGKTGKPKLAGLGLASENKRYIQVAVNGSSVPGSADLGCLTVYTAAALAKDELKPSAKTFDVDLLGHRQVRGDDVLPGEPFVFNKDNIERLISESPLA